MSAGEGDPFRTNRRFKLLSHEGEATRLSTAFDSVTLYGRDPDPRPDVYGKVGTSGVSVATLDDMKALFDGLFEVLHCRSLTDSVLSIIGIILILCKELRVQRFATVIAVAALALLTLGGCNSNGEEDGSIRVVATTTILGDLAQNVIGDAGEVVVLMPIGVNPHDFQPSAQQVAAIQKADIVIASGLGLEEGLSDVLEAAASDGVRVWEVGPDIDPRLFAEAPDADAKPCIPSDTENARC